MPRRKGHEVARKADGRRLGETGGRPERERAGERPFPGHEESRGQRAQGKDLYAMLALSSGKALGTLHDLPKLASELADKCNSKRAC